uniref:Uncharacterized protein n=1 Tax=Rhizophora mucronata TaxID=61149 RepID=A0A2P2NIM9_RHIMU
MFSTSVKQNLEYFLQVVASIFQLNQQCFIEFQSQQWNANQLPTCVWVLPFKFV